MRTKEVRKMKNCLMQLSSQKILKLTKIMSDRLAEKVENHKKKMMIMMMTMIVKQMKMKKQKYLSIPS